MKDGKKPVHTGHRARMRSRLAETGIEGFKPHEILEMLLFCVIPKRNVNPLAHALLDEFGSVDGVLSASSESLSRVPGVGPQTGEFFAALNKALEAYRETCYQTPKSIGTLASALQYVPGSVRKSRKYEVAVLFADRFSRLLSVHSFPGRPDDPAIIRAVLSKTLEIHSHNVILFLCGCREAAQPGKREIDSFQPMIRALTAVDAYAVDCVLLSKEGLFSLRREELIPGAATELQAGLSRWECWLGPIASAEGGCRWHPVSLLEDGGEM